MENNTKIISKLNEIKDLLFLMSAIELRKAGLSQGAVAKVLKASKTTVNELLKDAKIGKEDV
ncbi:MAG: hypothetical protein UT89_C0009G0007 [Parcubacteria group bacterium GW2011_GWE1_40_20]|nr:MAG: hypothetical protein UT89_C0009G0007 [Parcubacteria group bacterium GW2011_GWE1_40_20]